MLPFGRLRPALERARPRPLIALNGLEQRAEVPVAEARIACALDDLVEERTRLRIVVQEPALLQEDLQHVALVRAVYLNGELLQLLHGLLDGRHAQPDLLEAF